MPSELHDYFCENLRAEISRAKITQRQFAEMLDVSEAYVSQILSGRRVPGLDVIEKLAMALEISPSRLLRTPATVK